MEGARERDGTRAQFIAMASQFSALATLSPPPPPTLVRRSFLDPSVRLLDAAVPLPPSRRRGSASFSSLPPPPLSLRPPAVHVLPVVDRFAAFPAIHGKGGGGGRGEGGGRSGFCRLMGP